MPTSGICTNMRATRSCGCKVMCCGTGNASHQVSESANCATITNLSTCCTYMIRNKLVRQPIFFRKSKTVFCYSILLNKIALEWTSPALSRYMKSLTSYITLSTSSSVASAYLYRRFPATNDSKWSKLHHWVILNVFIILVLTILALICSEFWTSALRDSQNKNYNLLNKSYVNYHFPQCIRLLTYPLSQLAFYSFAMSILTLIESVVELCLLLFGS
jgi:hypothetical protein